MIFQGMALVGDGLREGGKRFVTGTRVHLGWMRNPEPAPDLGPRFQQDIEPAGHYVLHRPGSMPVVNGWVGGATTLENPLVIAFNLRPLKGYDARSWKAQLKSHFGVVGLELSHALLRLGYDAIVTVSLSPEGRPVETREIVLFEALPDPPPHRPSPT